MLMPIKLNYFGLIKIYDKIDLDLKFVFIVPDNLAHKIKTKFKTHFKVPLFS